MVVKKGFILFGAILAIGLSGCGGGSSESSLSTGEKIAKRNYVVVLKDVPTGICESQEYRDVLSEKFDNVVTMESDNSATCSDFGKENDGVECQESYYDGPESGDKACVIGVDGYAGKNGSYSRKTSDSFLPDSVDWLDAATIKLKNR